MLKIKDNVDLKELEKFGFKEGLDDGCHKTLIKYLGNNDYIAIYDDKSIAFVVEDFCGDCWDKFIEDNLQDLIKANLVEKVGNNNVKNKR